MPTIKVYKMDGKEAGTIDLSEKVFGAEYNEPLIHQAVVTRLANERQGTKSTLTRTEVRGGGRKPWRQKGTGNARQGSIRAPQWIKGGVVFAPKSRDFSKDMNKKAKVALKLDKSAVVVMDNDDVKVIRAAANIEKFTTLPVQQISTYEVVANQKVVMTKAAVAKIEEVYGE